MGAPPAPLVRKTWCSLTKEQGLAGREAPRRVRRRRLGLGRRGARRRKNKGLRGEKHHVGCAAVVLDSEDVVPGDEGTRVCGERSTTSGAPPSPWVSKTWCSATEEEGLTGDEAPRPVRRRRLGSQRRGARRRRKKGLRGMKHHVRCAAVVLGLKDVVLGDENSGTLRKGSRCFEWSVNISMT